MTKVKVQKELKDLINSAWWEEVAKLLRTIRQTNAVKILANMHSEEKTYSEMDFWRRQIQVVNALLKLPTNQVEVEEEIDLEKEIEKEAEQLEVWDVDDLFRSQD